MVDDRRIGEEGPRPVKRRWPRAEPAASAAGRRRALHDEAGRPTRTEAASRRRHARAGSMPPRTLGLQRQAGAGELFPGSRAMEPAIDMRPDVPSRPRPPAAARRRGTPRILAFATQGSGGGDEARLQALLSQLPVELVPFERTRKARMLLTLVGALACERPGAGGDGRNGRGRRARPPRGTRVVRHALRREQWGRGRSVRGVAGTASRAAVRALRAGAVPRLCGVHRVDAVSGGARADLRCAAWNDGRGVGAGGAFGRRARAGAARGAREAAHPRRRDRRRTRGVAGVVLACRLRVWLGAGARGQAHPARGSAHPRRGRRRWARSPPARSTG